MTDLPNFRLTSLGKLSQKLLEIGIDDFYAAVRYIHTLPYGRISNNRNLELLLSEGCGTRSIKHAFLVKLASEQQVQTLKLCMCSFNMCQENTRPAGEILQRHGIAGIPEVSCFIKYGDMLYDITAPDQCPREDIIADIEIAPQQIANFKRRYHQNYIENWIQLEKLRRFSVADIWTIREECIQALQENSPYHAQRCCA